MAYSVYLSPSTQERNIGVRGYGTEEMRMNKLAEALQSLLVKEGVKVYRNKPEWSLEEVVSDSNHKRPDLHIALHSNAGGGNGSEVFAYSAASRGATAARLIYAQLEPLTRSADRGIRFSTALYELRRTSAPAVLVEVGFHDNPTEAEWIIKNTNAIATAIKAGMMKYLHSEIGSKA